MHDRPGQRTHSIFELGLDEHDLEAIDKALAILDTLRGFSEQHLVAELLGEQPSDPEELVVCAALVANATLDLLESVGLASAAVRQLAVAP